MPRYSVMTFMFEGWVKEGKMTHEQMIAGFADAGVEGVEPFHRAFAADEALAGTYRRIVEDHGLRVSAVDVMCNLVYADAAQKREAQAALRRGLEICHELGADVAHVAGHRMVDGVSAADGRKMIGEQLAEAAQSDLGRGLTFAIEDFCPSPQLICSAAHCLEIIAQSGGLVKLVFDTGNFLAVDEWADKVFDALADHIVYCHFKDFIRTPGGPGPFDGVDLGDGEIPNAAVAKKLIARGYDGWVATETTSGRSDLDPVETIRLELPRLKSWFAAG